jgi:hypothetical protein
VSRAARCPKHAEQVAAGHTDPPACKGCDKAEALADLRELCPPGTTVYTILRSVSRSGMSRTITPVLLTPDGPRYLTHSVGLVLGLTAKRGFNDALRIDGGGMDMGFHLVNSLSYALHGRGDIRLGKLVDFDAGEPYRPGYTLNHRWL